MSDTIGDRYGGNLIYLDRDVHRRRLVDAIGPNVIKYHEQFVNPALVAADAPLGWTITLVEQGAGESTITKPAGFDAGLLFTTDANENDGINAQLDGQAFKLTPGCIGLHFYARLEASEATQLDFFIGLAVENTNLLGGVTDGIYFEKLDGGTGISAVSEKDSTETQTDNVGTLVAAQEVELEFYYDGLNGSIEYFVDGVPVAKHVTNIVDDEALTPSLQVLAGDANARTLRLAEIRVTQVGR